MAIYGINQHGSQMYINSIDGSDKLNVVKENGSIDSGSMEFQITAIVCRGFC